MAQQIINSTDNLPSGKDKINENFDELYAGESVPNITADVVKADFFRLNETASGFYNQFVSDGLLTGNEEVVVPSESGTLATREWIESNIVTNNSTVALTESDLNTAYPSAIIGFKVYAIDIIAGATLYTKIATNWVSTPITIVT